MNDDLEQFLERLTPRGADRAVRARVLGAVQAELRRGRTPAWGRRCLLAAAAMLLAAVGLNIWVYRAVDRRLARFERPDPAAVRAADVAEAIAAVTDAETGRWTFERLTAARRPADVPKRYAEWLKQVLDETLIASKDVDHESLEEHRPGVRERSGRRNRGAPGVQRLRDLEHRRTA